MFAVSVCAVCAAKAACWLSLGFERPAFIAAISSTESTKSTIAHKDIIK